MLKSILFILPILFFGVWTVCAVQDALEFGDLVRDALLAVLLIASYEADDRYGPGAAERKRERGRR
jgi:IMP cyclohydrolase